MVEAASIDDNDDHENRAAKDDLVSLKSSVISSIVTSQLSSKSNKLKTWRSFSVFESPETIVIAASASSASTRPLQSVSRTPSKSASHKRSNAGFLIFPNGACKTEHISLNSSILIPKPSATSLKLSHKSYTAFLCKLTKGKVPSAKVARPKIWPISSRV